MDLVVLIGRILFAALFISSGVNHIVKRKYMGDYAGQMGVPSPETLVPVSGAAIITGGVMLVLGLWGDLAALVLVAFLVPTTLFMHPFWKIQDPSEKAQQQIHFSKNMAMMGGALALMGWFACDSGLSLTGPLLF